MRIGIVGLPSAGKTTLFNLLTEGHVETGSGKMESHLGIAKVPDRRIDFLSNMYKPRKTIYAQIEFVDVPGLARGSAAKGGVNQFMAGVREADSLVQVVRAFDNPMVPNPEGSTNPVRDAELLHTELLLSDLEIVESESSAWRRKKGKENPIELPTLKKCQEVLESEGRIGSIDWTPEEQAALRDYGFLTEKPVILVANVGEDALATDDYPGKAELAEYARAKDIPLLTVSARTEQEISELPDEERDAFLKDLGVTESGIERLARAAYAQLGLISFFTVGEDEVRAWTIHQGTEAKKAAGKVHSDIERGFIRAEIVSYEDLHRLGSMAKVREQGLFRLEGKDYVMKDGDIVNFRFNI